MKKTLHDLRNLRQNNGQSLRYVRRSCVSPTLLVFALSVFVMACRPEVQSVPPETPLVQEKPTSESPYAGQEIRAIKALSEEEVAGYLAGKGMGLAKTAELNGYPGPKHVLELADSLALTPAQREQTQVLFEEMQAEAQKLGADMVEQEQVLDALFASDEADAGQVQAQVERIGILQAGLRFAHLRTHLKMKDILSRHQVMQYIALRGYDENMKHDMHQHKHEDANQE